LADQRITQLTALPKAGVAATDVLPIADISASQTKKVTAKDLVDAGLDLIDVSSIDIDKLDQASTTKLGTTALADDAVTAAKLANDSSIAVQTTAPSTDNFEGRGYYNTTSGALQVFDGSAYQQVVAPTAGIGDLQVTTGKLADGAVTTAKVTALGTAAYADSSVTTAKIADNNVTTAKIADGAITANQLGSGAVTTAKLGSAAVSYEKIQNVSATDRLLGRSTAGAGSVEEITCTAAGRALLDDADAATQRATLGLGTISTGNGTWADGGSFSGTSSGTNTGDQTITLTGDVTGTGTGSFATTIATGAVVEGKIATNAVTTSKINADAITAEKLADSSAAIVAASSPAGAGAFIGQQWFNTNNGQEFTWTGTAWIQQAGIGTINIVDSTPIAIAVTYPDPYSATLTTTLDTQAAATVFAGPATGADTAPTFRAIVPGDLPDATVSTKGIIQPGTGLAVDAGTLNHSNAVTGATVSSITFDNQGHITAAVPLVAADIPVLDASKITTGTFPTALIADESITGLKIADYANAQIGETLPVADHIGQFFFNPLEGSVFLWDGNVWQPVGVTTGAIILAGTYNATTNLIAGVTTEGTAIGLTVGSALPSAADANANYYVVVSTGGTGTAPAPVATLAPPDLILSTGSAWVEIDVSAGAGAIAAVNVVFSASGQIGSTNVQAAIEEVSTECRNADNITSGTLAVARGGTGLASYAKGDLVAATAATTLAKLTVGTNGQVLKANSSTATGLEWSNDFVGTVTTVTSSTGALTVATATTTPALTLRSATTSVNGIVQLSDSISTTSSILAATPTAVKSAYDLANAALPKAGGTVTGDITLGTNIGIQFEGTTDDGNEIRLIGADATEDRTITLPNVTGTVITTGDSGTVTSTMIANGTIVNADINASAAIAGTKISPDFGSQTIASAGVFSHALGAAATPSLTFTGDLNTGIFSPGADQVAVATNGTGRLFVDASGNVGVGDSSPSTRGRLSVFATTGVGRQFVVTTAGASQMRFDDNNARINLELQNYGMSAADHGAIISWSLGDSLANANTAGSITVASEGIWGATSASRDSYMAFSTTLDGSVGERVRITSAGNVGIGTTTPTEKLTVSGNVSVSGNVQAASINNGPLAGMRNAIINGNFDIWQRGTSFASPSDAAYTADRWAVRFNNTGATRTLSRQSFALGQTDVPGEPTYFMRFAQSVAGSGGTFTQLDQRIESVRTFAGQQVTISFWAKAAASTTMPSVAFQQLFGTGGSPSSLNQTTAGSSLALTTTWQKFSYQVTLPSISGKTLGTDNNDALIAVFFMPLNATFTIDIAQVQVEPGPVATPFERRPIGTELALCQRYYEAGSVSFCWNAGTPTDIKVTRAFVVTKRAAPTISGTGILGTFTSATGTVDRIQANFTATINGNVAADFTASAEL
jgi:hypothetical protein